MDKDHMIDSFEYWLECTPEDVSDYEMDVLWSMAFEQEYAEGLQDAADARGGW